MNKIDVDARIANAHAFIKAFRESTMEKELAQLFIDIFNIHVEELQELKKVTAERDQLKAELKRGVK